MKKKKPISAKPFWYSRKTGQQYDTKSISDCEYFHSVLEFQVYTDLLKIIPKHHLSRQVPLLYKPGTLNYPDLSWKVDFAARLPDETVVFIEAKGGWIQKDSFALAEFQHKLQYLEYCNHQAWENLYLVSPTEMNIDKFHKVLTPDELMKTLRLRMQGYVVDFGK